MRRVLVLAFVIVCAVAAVAAQQTPLFRASVDIVHLDVSVLNKDRQPVRGLTLADFTVLEDGKPQKIVAFTPVDVPDPPAPLPVGTSTWTRTVAPDVTSNVLPEGRLFVLLLDDLMLPADPAIADAARRAAKSVIAHLSTTDQMAVVFTGASGAAQNFTSDHTKLLAAVDQLKPGTVNYFMGWDTATPAALLNLPGPKSQMSNGPQFDSDDGLRTASMHTLEDVADALIGAPQHRKALILIGTGVPVNPGAAAPMLASGLGKGLDIRDASQRLAEGMSELFRRMQRSNITVYPIDPSGVGGLEHWITGRLSSLPAFGGTSPVGSGIAGVSATLDPSTGRVDPPGGIPTIQDLAHYVGRLDFDFLETVAANTGGRAIVNTNDFDPGLRGLARKVLQSYGYVTIEAATGSAAVDVATRAPTLDVLLTDMVMPELGGPPLFAAVRGAHPSVTVVYMSGYTEQTIAVEDLAHVGGAFLAKPFTAVTLVRTIREALDR